MSGEADEHETPSAADRLLAGGDPRVVGLEGEAVGAPEVFIGHPEPVSGVEQVDARSVRSEPARDVQAHGSGDDQSPGVGVDHRTTMTAPAGVRPALRGHGDGQ